MTPTRPTQPVGDVTFLLTDIEGSTPLLSRIGRTTYIELLRLHNEIIRDAISLHGGYEVGTEGDSFLIAFSSPAAALGAAVQAQSSLQRHPWPSDGDVRVRMGLHRGPAEPGEEHAYIALTLHQAVRVGHAPHGGQVVCTSEVLEGLGPAMTATRLGSYWLRDFPAPVALHQVGPVGVEPVGFPALRAPRADLSNVPGRSGRLFGRDDECELLRRETRGAGLVTLTGPGGIGKTRLALAIAGDDASAGRPAWFVELAQVEADAGLEAVVATACRALGTTGSSLGALTDKAGAPATLLVVDNAEHVVDAAAVLCEHLLAELPELSLLVTSREPLAIGGEQVVRLRPLAVDAGAESPAFQLFVERARAADRSFQLTAGTVETVTQLCRELDGVPLALELAAARAATLRPADLLDRVRQVGDVPGAVRRGRSSRHSTLSAVLDWSLERCSETERAVLRRMGVFAGAVELEAVAVVCGGGSLPAPAVVDAVGSLVDKSLVVVREEAAQRRYDVLVVVRRAALERLLAADERAEALHRHACWTLEHVRRICPYGTEHDVPSLMLVLPEALAVLERGAGGDVPLTVYADLFVALSAHLTTRDAGVGIRHGRTLLGSGELDVQRTAQVWSVLTTALIHADDDGRVAAAEQALQAARAAGDLPLLATALCKSASPDSQADVASRQDARALRLLEEAALLIADAAADPRRYDILVHMSLGIGALFRGSRDEARRHYLQAYDAADAAGDRGNLAIAVHNLAELDALNGDLESAAERYEQAAASLGAQARYLHQSFALLELADVLDRLGRLDDADDAASHAVVSARRATRRPLLQRALVSSGQYALRRGQHERARSAAAEAVGIDAASAGEARLLLDACTATEPSRAARLEGLAPA